MTLRSKIQDDIKASIKSGDKYRLAALRMTLAAIKNAETAPGRANRGELNDQEVAALLQTEVKRRRDTIAELEKVDRPEMLADERAELAALSEYLPQQLSREQVTESARAVIAETGAKGPAQMGEVMKRLMAQFKGQADGKMVSDVVRELLTGH